MKNPENNQKNRSETLELLFIALKLLIISSITALLLSCVNALTAPTIAANTEAEKKSAIAAIFSDADEIAPSDITTADIDSIYIASKNGSPIGYAASVSPNGFGGALELMVGISTDGSVAGIKLVSHSETPGLGSRVSEDSFLGQFSGLSGKISLGSDVDAITGSTISSKAVTSGVNSALAAYESIFSDSADNGGAK